MDPYKYADDVRTLLGYRAENAGVTFMEYIENSSIPNDEREANMEVVFLFRPSDGMF